MMNQKKDINNERDESCYHHHHISTIRNLLLRSGQMVPSSPDKETKNVRSIGEGGGGFCNYVYSVDIPHEKSLVVKIFSSNAKQRLHPMPLGLADLSASHVGIGPKIYCRSDDAIVMECLGSSPTADNAAADDNNHKSSLTLTEADIHGVGRFGNGSKLCTELGKSLAMLHSASEEYSLSSSWHSSINLDRSMDHIPLLLPTNVLDYALDGMIANIQKKSSLINPDSTKNSNKKVFDPNEILSSLHWNMDTLLSQLHQIRTTLLQLDLPMTNLAHGDLKPSNIMMITPTKMSTNIINNDNSDDVDVVFVNSRIVFIDHELGGPGYRGYDICKLFRTKMHSTQQTSSNQIDFAKSYLDVKTSSCDNGSSHSCSSSKEDAIRLMNECRLFEPLTWLEAVIFFLFAASSSSKNDNSSATQTQKNPWESLVLDRLQSYEASLDIFDKSIEAYYQSL